VTQAAKRGGLVRLGWLVWLVFLMQLVWLAWLDLT
jgi:hypothetical protein